MIKNHYYVCSYITKETQLHVYFFMDDSEREGVWPMGRRWLCRDSEALCHVYKGIIASILQDFTEEKFCLVLLVLLPSLLNIHRLYSCPLHPLPPPWSQDCGAFEAGVIERMLIEKETGIKHHMEEFPSSASCI